MTFILYSDINASSISNSLGAPEYSYYFVLRGFQTALEALGNVVVVQDPNTEVDEIYSAHLQSTQANEPCIFFCCAPPHRCPTNLQCPTVSVFAWEFSNIPYETWDNNPNNDWRQVFSSHGMAIALSSDAARAVKEAMGENFPVTAIPVPVWDQFAAYHTQTNLLPFQDIHSIEFSGDIIDSKTFEDKNTPSAATPTRQWNGKELKMNFSLGNAGHASSMGSNISALTGFYAPEEWGAWSRTPNPSIILSRAVTGNVALSVEALAHGNNVNRVIKVHLGNQSQSITIGPEICTVSVDFHLDMPAGEIRFSELDLTRPADSKDPRTMAIGLRSICIRNQQFADSMQAIDSYLAEIGVNNTSELWQGDTLTLDLTTPNGQKLIQHDSFQENSQGGDIHITHSARVLLPESLCGRALLSLTLDSAHPADTQLIVRHESQSFILSPTANHSVFEGEIHSPSAIEELLLEKSSGSTDQKDQQTPFNLAHLQIIAPERSTHSKPTTPAKNHTNQTFSLNGIVYTSILNPSDGRKNWGDIVTAFVWAMREHEDATLVLKMTTADMSSFAGTLHVLINQLAPFKCRIIAVRGYLTDEQYSHLIQATSFYVNASHCEGLCLPLMEYMSAGTPSIAPCNTAMEDYITPASTLIVNSSLELNVWPHDPRDLFRTLRYRINWESLMRGFQDSYKIARQTPEQYKSMSSSAEQAIKNYASLSQVKAQLKGFIKNHSSRLTQANI